MLPIVKPYLPPPEVLMPELESTLYSGYIAEGEKVKEFERLFAEYVGNKYCLTVNSGTSALHLALVLAGVDHGDEVISTALTAEPTNTAILQTGAKIVWADIDPINGTIATQSVRARITSKTKAIMVVHYAGMVANLKELTKISKEFNIPIIEDAAHALGAKYCNSMIGSISDYTIFSFQAIKHITTVDGGMLAVKDENNYKQGRIKRWFGIDKEKSRLDNNITELGYKYHMNNVNATIGIVQMKTIDSVVGKYISNGKFFDQQLKNVDGIELMEYYDDTEPSYWLYTLKVDRRDDFVRCLESKGIASSVLHRRNDYHQIFGSGGELPELEKFYSEMVHFGCGWWLTEPDREFVIKVIKEGW